MCWKKCVKANEVLSGCMMNNVVRYWSFHNGLICLYVGLYNNKIFNLLSKLKQGSVWIFYLKDHFKQLISKIVANKVSADRLIDLLTNRCNSILIPISGLESNLSIIFLKGQHFEMGRVGTLLAVDWQLFCSCFDCSTVLNVVQITL